MPKKIMNRHEMPIGAVINDPGCSMQYETGGWRNARPIHDNDKCTHCLLCWVYCPEGCITVKDAMITDIDLKYCKGCGICMQECPLTDKAIQMIEEKR